MTKDKADLCMFGMKVHYIFVLRYGGIIFTGPIGGGGSGLIAACECELLIDGVGEEVDRGDEAAVGVRPAVNAVSAVLGPPEPRGLGAISAGLILLNGVSASAYEWVEGQITAWLTE